MGCAKYRKTLFQYSDFSRHLSNLGRGGDICPIGLPKTCRLIMLEESVICNHTVEEQHRYYVKCCSRAIEVRKVKIIYMLQRLNIHKVACSDSYSTDLFAGGLLSMLFIFFTVNSIF